MQGTLLDSGMIIIIVNKREKVSVVASLQDDPNESHY